MSTYSSCLPRSALPLFCLMLSDCLLFSAWWLSPVCLTMLRRAGTGKSGYEMVEGARAIPEGESFEFEIIGVVPKKSSVMEYYGGSPFISLFGTTPNLNDPPFGTTPSLNYGAARIYIVDSSARSTGSLLTWPYWPESTTGTAARFNLPIYHVSKDSP